MMCVSSVVLVILSRCALSGMSSGVYLPSCAEPLMPMLLRLWGSVRILEAVVAGHTLGNPIDRSHFISPFGLAMPD